MLLTEHTLNYIKFLESGNKLMEKFQTTKGFYEVYNDDLCHHELPELAFKSCNYAHFRLFGYYRFNNSFDDFLKVIDNRLTISQQKMSPKEVLEREFLIAWFKQCGFDTWTSFKAIVLHHFPEVTEIKLLEFWQNTAIDAHVLIRVNHVKQILG
jgi:hypothetical protein